MPDALNDHLVARTWVRDRSSRQHGLYRTERAETQGRGGRETLVFRRDGTFSMTGPGPDDRTQVLTGTWSVEEQGRQRVILRFDRQDTRAIVEQKADDEIVLRGVEEK